MSTQTLIEKAAIRCNYDNVAGDYLEFGTFRGRSVINSYRALKNTFENRLTHEAAQTSAGHLAQCQEQWSAMRFICFDSFEGPPEMTGVDLEGSDFRPGQFSCSIDDVRTNLRANEVDLAKCRFVKGWYRDTCVPATKETLQIKSAPICLIDCNLYQSTSEVLSFLKDILVDGSILVFNVFLAFEVPLIGGSNSRLASLSSRCPVGSSMNFNEKRVLGLHFTATAFP
jgi:O-methyltransferase